MRKLLAIILLFLSGASIASMYYYVQQASQVPKWYQVKSFLKKEAKRSLANRTNSLEGKILKFSRGQEVKFQLSSEEINELIKILLVKELGNQEPKGLPEGISAKIENNELEIGGIVNLADLAEADMRPYYKQIIQRIATSFPQFANRNLYLGIQGDPVLNQGKLSLSPNSLIKVGNLSFTTEDIAKVTGISEEMVREKIAFKLKSVTVKDLSIQQDKLNLTLSKNN